MGVVCKNQDGSIQSLELLGLWEARTIYSRIPTPTSLSIVALIEKHLQTLKNSIYSDEEFSH